VPYKTQFGLSLWIVGSSKTLGEWQIEGARKMHWEMRNYWSIQTFVDAGDQGNTKWEYKYVLRDDKTGKHEWESGPNHVVELEKADAPYLKKVFDKFQYAEQETVSKIIPKSSATAVIVLGKSLFQHGEPHYSLISRMSNSAQYFQQHHAKNKDDIMIVTGGKVRSDVFSEAQVMKDLAMQEGVDAERIIMEESANNTIENALFTLDLLYELGVQSVVIITADYHLPRVQTIFERILPKHFKRAYKSEHPDLTPLERQQEEQNEQKMLANLDAHLANYGVTKK